MPVIRPAVQLLNAPAGQSMSIACDTCAVRDRSICATLTQAERTLLNAISHFKDFSAGEPIFHNGEDQSFFATIVKGTLKLTKSLPDGRQQIVGLQFPAGFLGRPWRHTNPYDATAASDVTLCMFSRSRFEELTRRHPNIGHELLAHTLDDLDAAQEWLLLLGRKTAAERVASLLLLVARHLAPPGTVTRGNARVSFDLPLTRNEMADCLGLTLETVSRQMTSLRKAGAVEISASGRRIVVRDLAALAVTASGEAAE